MCVTTARQVILINLLIHVFFSLIFFGGRAVEKTQLLNLHTALPDSCQAAYGVSPVTPAPGHQMPSLPFLVPSHGIHTWGHKYIHVTKMKLNIGWTRWHMPLAPSLRRQAM